MAINKNQTNNTMIKCIAIDDEPMALDIIKNHVSRVPFLTLEGAFVDPFKAVTFLNENPVDLVFLDINMPDIDGLELLKHFAKKPFIIFTTAHSEYALQSYEVEAVDYLLKPFDFGRFLLSVNKVKERFSSETAAASDFFFVNTGNQRRRIFYHEIAYVEGEGNYVKYCTANDKILVRSSIKETLGILPSSMFVQIHRSYIVSLQWIDKIEDNHVYIAGNRISIGATYRENFLKTIDGLT